MDAQHVQFAPYVDRLFVDSKCRQLAQQVLRRPPAAANAAWTATTCSGRRSSQDSGGSRPSSSPRAMSAVPTPPSQSRGRPAPPVR